MSGTSPIVANLDPVVVLEPGTYNASTGKVSFSAADIRDIQGTPVPAGGFPIILGHSSENDEMAPAVGFVTQLGCAADRLTNAGTFNDNEVAVQSQEGGKYSRRSPGLIRVNGKWQFQHLALLGAHDPANPNLPPIKSGQVTFLSAANPSGEVVYLAGPAHEEEAPVTDNGQTEIARLAGDNDALREENARLRAEKEAADEQVRLAAAKNEADDKELARLSRESRCNEAERFVNGLENLKLAPVYRADGTALLAALLNADEKVRLSASGRGIGEEQDICDAFKAFLSRLVPVGGDQAALGAAAPVGDEADPNSAAAREGRIRAYMGANGMDDTPTNYTKAMMATKGGTVNG